MFGQLGDIKFEYLDAPRSLTKTMGVNIVELERLSGKPTTQIVGGKLDTISMKFSLVRGRETVELKVDRLRDMMRLGEPVNYVTGAGRNEGEYQIYDLNVDWSRTNAVGEIIYAELSVELKEYVSPDPVSDEALLAQKNAFANISVNPIVATPEIRYQTPESLIMKQVISANADGSAASATLKKTNNVSADNTQKYLDTAGRALNRAKDSMYQARQSVDSIASKITNAVALKGNMDAVIANIDSILTDFNHANLPNIRNMTTALDSSLQTVFYASSQIASVIALRK